jgi:hypothetical protein
VKGLLVSFTLELLAGIGRAWTISAMIIVAAEAGGTVNSELIANLSSFAHVPAILEGVAAAVGSRYDQLSDGRLFPVVGYVLRPEDVFTAYVATPFLLSVFELDRSGTSLIVTFPWSRVSRVVQSTANGSLSVSFELDADQLDILGEVRNVEGVSKIEGVMRRAGYALNVPASSDEASALLRYASLVRRHLRA